MKLFLDTNVLVASLTDEEARAEAATAVLNLSGVEDVRLFTSLVNLMELRTVLAKKHRQELDAVNDAIGEVVADFRITLPDASDMLRAFDLQNETLMYPMDAIIVQQAKSVDAEVVTFDSEVLDDTGMTPEAAIEQLEAEAE